MSILYRSLLSYHIIN